MQRYDPHFSTCGDITVRTTFEVKLDHKAPPVVIEDRGAHALALHILQLDSLFQSYAVIWMTAGPDFTYSTGQVMDRSGTLCNHGV
jgi:hypothetical protein